jgi:Flp pilus assembly protein TadD
MVGLLLPLNWALNRLWNTTVGALQVSSVRIILAAVGVILALACFSVTRAYMTPWQDTVMLLQYYLTQTPNEWKLHNRLGGEWLKRGNLDRAIAECMETVRLDPAWATNHLNLGRVLFMAGRFDEAQMAFAAALQLEPNNWQAHILMGKTLSKMGELEGALKEFQTAAQLHPMEAEVHYDIANILAGQGKLAEAVQEYQQALQLNPNYWEAQSALDAITSQQP